MNAGPSTLSAVHVQRRLPLHALHLAHGARLEPFAGWSMPIHYPPGILAEHRHTRASAGLFDISHMGQIRVRSRTGGNSEAALALEGLVPSDLLSLRCGRQRYALFTTASGGISDDLMIANLQTGLFLVVNAARVEDDLRYLRERLPHCTVELLSDRALLAIQGPAACAVLAERVPGVTNLRFMDAAEFTVDGMPWIVTRSGYTGEDGFELSVPSECAAEAAERFLRHPSVKLVGLGARDSLRLEAGLCLYGRDLTADTTPVEASLEWAIQSARRPDGARAGGFPGAEVIHAQLAHGAPRLRVGMRSESRPVREGAAIYADDTSQVVLGHVTSGTYAPSAGHPVAMGYIPTAAADVGTRLCAEVRGQRIPVTVTEMPFVPHRYRR